MQDHHSLLVNATLESIRSWRDRRNSSRHNRIRPPLLELSAMVHTLEALLLSALLLAPCAAILERCVADGSLFALHPAANALAFLICFPL